MEQALKDKVIQMLTDSLIQLIDELEICGTVSTSTINELFELFKKLNDIQPQVVENEMEINSEDTIILERYVIKEARKLGLMTRPEFLKIYDKS